MHASDLIQCATELQKYAVHKNDRKKPSHDSVTSNNSYFIFAANKSIIRYNSSRGVLLWVRISVSNCISGLPSKCLRPSLEVRM